MTSTFNGSGGGSEGGSEHRGWAAGSWVDDSGASFDSPLGIEYQTQPCLLGSEDERSSRDGFLDSWWSPEWRAQLILAEFAADASWQKMGPTTPLDDRAQSVRGEIAALLNKRDQRSGRMVEIVSQSDSFVDCWAGLLGAVGRRPHTQLLIYTGVTIGKMVAMYWKSQFNRARPSQVFPLLLPPISVPAHPSYPSGHATQSHLIAELVAGTLPGILGNAIRPTLKAMAVRIAENREIAGLHYESDSEAGRELAENIAPMILNLSAFKDMKKGDKVKEGVKSGVASEWTGISVDGPPGIIRKWLSPGETMMEATGAAVQAAVSGTVAQVEAAVANLQKNS